MEELILGVDIGGTHTRFGLVTEGLDLSCFQLIKTTELFDGEEPVTVLIQTIESYIKANQAEGKLRAISLGFPSTLDRQRKRLVSTPNIKGFDNIDIVSVLEEGLGIEAIVERDVNLLLTYDIHQFHIKSVGTVSGFYIGTGLGNSIMINGQILIGENGASAELGHIPNRDVEGQCGCGNTYCVELFASGKYLDWLCHNRFNNLAVKDIFLKMRHHPLIRKFVTDLAFPIATEINILDPHTIILGGGVIQMDGFPRGEFEKIVHRLTRVTDSENKLQVIYSNENQAAGVLGAGLHGFQKIREKGRVSG